MPDGRLTKTRIKEELQRRIRYFEEGDAYSFTSNMSYHDFVDASPLQAIAFGRYRALLEMHWQIENGIFTGGFVA